MLTILFTNKYVYTCIYCQKNKKTTLKFMIWAYNHSSQLNEKLAKPHSNVRNETGPHGNFIDYSEKKYTIQLPKLTHKSSYEHYSNLQGTKLNPDENSTKIAGTKHNPYENSAMLSFYS